MANAQKQKMALGGSVTGSLNVPTPGSRAIDGSRATLRDYVLPVSL
jgi:hypothetical protein